MLYTDICQKCGEEEDDFRTSACKNDQPTGLGGEIIPCKRCGSRSWKVQEFYVPQRCWGLKGENESFPLKSHLKDNNGNSIVFNSLKQYESHLDSKGLAIAGNMAIGTPPEPKAVPTKELESHPVFRKMKDMEKQGKTESPKFLPKEEVENEFGN
tara:strand:- start:892 stop:1356 length:465 start_codon:yes stop_codon:yes gene_type:complete